MNYKKFLLIILLIPLTINAKEVTVYREYADANADIYASTDWYTYTESSEFVSESECKEKGGTFSRKAYKYTANYLSCSVSTKEYYNCSNVVYYAADSYCNTETSKNKQSYCVKSATSRSGVNVSIETLKSTSGFKYSIKNSETDFISDKFVCYQYDSKNCSNKDVLSWRKVSGNYGTCTYEQKESGSSEKHIVQAVYKTNSGAAYCIHPGKIFYEESDTYILSSSQDLTNCKSSKDSNKYCGLAAIVQEAQANYSTYSDEYYIAVNTALRLWTAKYLSNTGNDSYWDSQTEKLYTRANIYKTTANYIISNGYSGSNTSPKKGVLYGTSVGLKNGIEIFKKAVNGININNPEISISPTAINKTTGVNDYKFTLTTGLTDKNAIKSITATNGVTITYGSLYDCNSKLCVDVTANLANLTSNSFSLKVQLNNSSSILSSVGYYNSSHGTNAYQSMIIFDNSDPNPINVNVTVNNTPTTSKCDTTIIDTVSNDCESDGTGGKLQDAEICAVLNAGKTDNEYETHSNEYCEVTCREEYTFTFMDKKTALAGRYFRYDVNNDENYYSTLILSEKQCVSNIDYDKWKVDYKKIYDKVRTTWNEYMKYKAMVNNVTKKTIIKTASGCNLSCDCGSHLEPIEGSSPTEYHSVTDYCDKTISPSTSSWSRYEHSKASYLITNSDGSTSTSKTTAQNYGSTYDEATTSCGCDGAYVSYTDGTAGEKSLISKKDDAYDNYKEAVDALNELVYKLNNCNLINTNRKNDFYDEIIKYNPQNTLNIEYQETTPNTLNGESYNSYISGSIQRDQIGEKEVSYSYGLDSYNSYCNNCEGDLSNLSSDTNVDSELFYWDCDESKNQCFAKYPNYPKNKTVTLNVSINNGYYVGIEFATQVFTGYTVSKNDTVGKNWIDLPTKIYPVELNQKTTTNKEIYVIWTVSNITNNILKNTTTDTYKCYYDVVNKLTTYDCDDVDNITEEEICIKSNNSDDNSSGQGLILYYRTIDLNKVFPNTDKRNTGVNWTTEKAVKVIKNIEDLGDNIYTKEPMYSVTLTASDIKKIREYNKDEESNYGYLNNTIECDNLNNNSNLKYVCNSTFLNKNIKNNVTTNLSSSVTTGDSLYYYIKEGGN